MNLHIAPALISLIVLPTALAAQTASAPLTETGSAARRVEVPEGTEFVAVFTEAISSKSSANGDAVKLKVDEAVVINGDTVIRSGAMVRGTITEAKGAGFMGRGGKLNMSVESVTLADGQHAKVRSAKAKGGDEKRGQTVALTVLFGPLGLLRRGNDAEIKAGTPVHLFTDDAATITLSR
jgi:hypothetical protein